MHLILVSLEHERSNQYIGISSIYSSAVSSPTQIPVAGPHEKKLVHALTAAKIRAIIIIFVYRVEADIVDTRRGDHLRNHQE
jgi:hypothetical protein